MTTTEISIPSRIGPRCNGMSMTREEFREHDNWVSGYRYELVHGVLIVNPPPDIGERNPNDVLGHLIRVYWETVIDADGVYSTPLLPGFELSVARILAIADRYAPQRKSRGGHARKRRGT